MRNLERSLRFYSKVMGMQVSLRGEMKHGGKYVHLKNVGSTQRLELNYYPLKNMFYERFRSGSELDHLAFWVKDVDQKYEELLTKGARAAVRPFEEGRYKLAFLKDPDGIWIELIGRNRPINQRQRKRKEKITD